MRFLLLGVALLSLSACHPGRRPRVTADPLPIAPRPKELVADAPHFLVDPPLPPPIVRDPPALAEPVISKRRDFAALVESVNRNLLDAYFAYDRAELPADGLDALRKDAALLLPLLSEFPDAQVIVEGHCDERGSAEYNLALGDRRAQRAVEALKMLGLPQSRLEPVSYGNERPQCDTPAESCWRLNRRAHLVLRSR
jgi:peptidoglycan-associated lipoprotein